MRELGGGYPENPVSSLSPFPTKEPAADSFYYPGDPMEGFTGLIVGRGGREYSEPRRRGFKSS